MDVFPHDNTGSDSEVPAPSPPLGQGLLPPDTAVRKGEAGTALHCGFCAYMEALL